MKKRAGLDEDGYCQACDNVACEHQLSAMKRVAALEAALRDEWERNHAEMCGISSPPDQHAHACMYPLNPLLKSP